MSSTIWTRCAADRAIAPFRGTVERLVENQTLSSTRPLLDSAAEHEVLEALLEADKPSVPAHARGLSYLLAAPFRYPPLPWGSRFGTRLEPSIWYGSLDRSALLAEAAYYAFVRLEHAPGVTTAYQVRRTSFRAKIAASRWLDWTATRFSSVQRKLRHRSDYRATAQLGADMRTAGVQGFTFASARDTEGGRNVGLFTGEGFAARRESHHESWSMWVTRQVIEFRSVSAPQMGTVAFPREQFLDNGVFPLPAAR